jgi:Leucine-rich repeat (LRR) protein
VLLDAFALSLYKYKFDIYLFGSNLCQISDNPNIMKRIGLILGVMVLTTFPLFSQYVTIPDSAFLYALIGEGVDTDGDSLISINEAEAVNGLYISNAGIHDMTGIEEFVKLDTLICEINPIYSLDVSNCISLKYLDVSHVCGFSGCGKSILKTLDISNNPALEELYCSGNRLTSLDLSGCNSLKKVYCSENDLTRLDISKNTVLTILRCGSNQLTSLDVSTSSELTDIVCYDNLLASLDVSNCDKLT